MKANKKFFEQLRKEIEDDNITPLFPNVNKFLETVYKCVHDGNDGKNEEGESLCAQVEQLKTQLKQANEQLEELKSKQQPITDPDEDVVYALDEIENTLTEGRDKIFEGKSAAERVFNIKIPFVRSNKQQIMHEVGQWKEKMNEANYSHYYNVVWSALSYMENDPFNSDELYCGLNTILQYLLKFYDTDKVALIRPKIENIIQKIENSNEEQDTCYCTRNRSKAVIKGIKDFWGMTENTEQAAKVAEYKKNTEEVEDLQAENKRLKDENEELKNKKGEESKQGQGDEEVRKSYYCEFLLHFLETAQGMKGKKDTIGLFLQTATRSEKWLPQAIDDAITSLHTNKFDINTLIEAITKSGITINQLNMGDGTQNTQLPPPKK